MPYTDNPHHESEILTSFNCLNLFKPVDFKQKYFKKNQKRKFPIRNWRLKKTYGGENSVSCETNYKLVNYS